MDSLEQITKDIFSCQRCELRQNATRPVAGLGYVGAKYFLIGEAPGREEDEGGVPFVGQAGRRLDKLLVLAKISINDCFLSNVCRCRPPQNRDPKKKEIRACVDFLWREIKLVKPQYIITLGATPLGLFTQSGGVSQLHGTSFEWQLDEENPIVFPKGRKERKGTRIEEEIGENYANILSGLFQSSS